jgi:hypothetical protein
MKFLFILIIMIVVLSPCFGWPMDQSTLLYASESKNECVIEREDVMEFVSALDTLDLINANLELMKFRPDWKISLFDSIYSKNFFGKKILLKNVFLLAEQGKSPDSGFFLCKEGQQKLVFYGSFLDKGTRMLIGPRKIVMEISTATIIAKSRKKNDMKQVFPFL